MQLSNLEIQNITGAKVERTVQYWKYEGKIPRDPEALIALAKHFGTTVDELLSEHKETNK